jgi:hypothetical protein
MQRRPLKPRRQQKRNWLQQFDTCQLSVISYQLSLFPLCWVGGSQYTTYRHLEKTFRKKVFKT